MYESFFGLRESAFALTPDPRFLWLSGTHEEGLAALYYGITRRKGFILLTGEVGAGKTTLLRAALDQIPDRGPLVIDADVRGHRLGRQFSAACHHFFLGNHFCYCKRGR